MATLYILYGSATGNAEGIAKDLADKSPPAPFSSIVCKPMESFKKLLPEWAKAPTCARKHGIIFIASTTGNGDAPENASRFVRYIKRKQTVELQPFQHCSFSVLGLGDTNYDQFCAVGKLIDKKVLELGGTHGCPLACADEATGLEDVVEPWLETILDDMSRSCRHQEETSSPPESNEADPQRQLPTASIPTVISPVSDAPADAVSKFPLFILYGSATGNAEQIAKDLAATYESLLSNPDANTVFPSVICCDLNVFKKKCVDIWNQEPEYGMKHGLIVVASTTGNGDAPENAGRFMRYIRRKQTVDEQPFRNVSYTVLALGDTNYDQFCNTGKLIDKRLGELGGTRAQAIACADEATGLEDVVDPWVNSVLAVITKACRGGSDAPSDSQAVRETASSRLDEALPEEEKKVEAADQDYSPGVAALRSLLSLDCNAPIPDVNYTCLPSLGASRSSCELFTSDNVTASSRRYSFDERATISSTSSGALHYTLARPFESPILEARYLTKTSTAGAARVSEDLAAASYPAAVDVVAARKVLDEEFPLDHTDTEISSRNGKRVIELTLSLPDDYTMEYQPGDALGLVVSNTPSAVSFVISMLQEKHGILPDQKISIDSMQPITVEEAVRENIDLCSPIKNRKLLYSLSQFATNGFECCALRLLASKTPEGEKAFSDYVVSQRRNFIDLLRDFPSCQDITLNGLLSMLPAIPPRYYSVSSSPLTVNDEGPRLTVALSVVDYLTPPMMVNGAQVGCRRISGLATGYLEAVCSPLLCQYSGSTPTAPSVKIFPKPTTDFRLPPDESTPIVLIGPGTGVAPFIGFLKHRLAQKSSGKAADAANAVTEGTWRGGYDLEAEDIPVGKNDASGLVVGADFRQQRQVGEVELYFGCRHQDHDWLYEKEMEMLKEAGVVTNLNVAFSRDGHDSKYVQDIMKNRPESAKRLADIVLNRRGYVYICGDGNQMARDVQATIADIITTHLGDDQQKRSGQSVVDQMKKEGRFLLDIWS